MHRRIHRHFSLIRQACVHRAGGFAASVWEIRTIASTRCPICQVPRIGHIAPIYKLGRPVPISVACVYVCVNANLSYYILLMF